ncbi:hypothetical protein MTO96_002428 [Rhipicephalus appendiculatus]
MCLLHWTSGAENPQPQILSPRLNRAFPPVPPRENQARDRAGGRDKLRRCVPTDALRVLPTSARGDRVRQSWSSSRGRELRIQRPSLYARTSCTELHIGQKVYSRHLEVGDLVGSDHKLCDNVRQNGCKM